jgi:fucose permease
MRIAQKIKRLTGALREDIAMSFLTFLCVVATVAFIGWNVNTLMQNFDTAFTQPNVDISSVQFDIEGFENLNLIRR